MKHKHSRITTLTFFVASAVTLALATEAHAQWLRFGCSNGSCNSYAYSSRSWSTCRSCSYGSQNEYQLQGGCATGNCGAYQATTNVPCATGTCSTNAPTCQNGDCSIQSESATYDLADKIEITYTRAKFKCIQCGIALETPLEENAVYECTNCRKQYAVKEGAVYDITKTADEGYQKADVAGKTGEKNSLIGALLQRVNATRARYGLCALAQDSNLESQSFNQAVYCARAGYLWHGAGAAEILAMNWQGFETAINQWLNSPPHRSLLLNGGFRFAGVATYRDGYGRVWCAVRFR